MESSDPLKKDCSLCGPYSLFLQIVLCLEAGKEALPAIPLSLNSESTVFFCVF